MQVLSKSHNRKTLVPVVATGHPSIQIESSPFALVNPALFVSYLSRGTVAYIATAKGATGTQEAIAILSDITYLEGMEGGAVCLDRDDSHGQLMGLVLGSLRKNTGEGKMTVIIPWDLIAESVMTIIPSIDKLISKNYRALNHSPASSLITPPNSPPISAVVPVLPVPTTTFQGVVAIVVSTGKVRMWGSGVLIDHSTIVTNLHVLGINPSRITAWFSSSEQIDLSILGTPIDGIDMVFLKLDKPTVHKPLVISKRRPIAGTKVKSVGYGIFYPHGLGGSFQPLASIGIISKVFHMPLNDNYPLNQSDSLPAMIISSAGCWNGSSGGAVIDQQSTHLIGLMASNGRSHRSGEIICEMAFVIPSNIVDYGWSLLKSSQTVHASSRVRQLWKLQPTHKSIYKLKPRI